jgi:hypothetical protein
MLSVVGAGRPSRKLPVDLDRRCGQRFHTVLRVAKVERAHDSGLWQIRNISDGGMMMLTSVPVTPGEPLTIHFSDHVSLKAKAAWWDGTRCGVEFDEEVDCAALLEALVAEQKRPGYRPARLPVSARAIAYCEKGLHGIRIYNLSHHGAAFEHDGCFRAGMMSKLAFENGGEHRGVVRWSKDGCAGIFLVEPMAYAKLESATRL